MTTAQDLPLSVHPAVAPATPLPDRPPLALVPAPAPHLDAAGEDIVDFDDALRAAFPRLHRYAARRLQDQHEAEEVVQEAMLRAFTHRGTLRTQDDLMAWLTVVTGRLVIDRLRVRGRMTPVAELPAGSRSVRDTADVVVARDEARMALDVLEAMPARQASVLWSREVEGLSYEEISERYGLSEPTVRSLLHRARKTLRREYAVRGGTVPSLGLVAFAPWLRGLRIAARLRDAARKTTGAAAVTATGLAVATFAPLWSHPATTQPHVAAIPNIVVNAATRSVADLPRHTVARSTEVAPTHVAPAADPRIKTALRKLPVSCGGAVSTGCDAPSKPMLFITTPIKQVGVSAGDLPACTTLPDTLITHCQPSDRKN